MGPKVVIAASSVHSLCGLLLARALPCAVARTPALQQTTCALQVQVTKMAAQSSGNAFTGAVDDAISEGFSEGRGHKFES